MVATSARLQDVEPTRPHLGHYKRWLEEIVKEVGARTYYNVRIDENFFQAPMEKQVQVIESLHTTLQPTEAAATATAIYRIWRNCEAIFLGKTEELGLLLEDGVLHSLYDFMQNSDYRDLLRLVAHKKPNLKVLEIGAGTGATTATILPALWSNYGERMYSLYTYTDVSSGFFTAAKDRFRDDPAMQYAVLDISQDPIEQGFEPASFDLVIACNVSGL